MALGGAALSRELCAPGVGGSKIKWKCLHLDWTGSHAGQEPTWQPAPPAGVCPSALLGTGVVSLVVGGRESGGPQEHPQLEELGGQISVGTPDCVGR